MTPTLFVGFGTGAWAITAAPSSVVNATVVKVRIRPLPFIRANGGYHATGLKACTTSEREPDVGEDPARILDGCRLVEERRREHAAVADVVVAVGEVVALDRERQPVPDCVGECAHAGYLAADKLRGRHARDRRRTAAERQRVARKERQRPLIGGSQRVPSDAGRAIVEDAVSVRVESRRFRERRAASLVERAGNLRSLELQRDELEREPRRDVERRSPPLISERAARRQQEVADGGVVRGRAEVVAVERESIPHVQ